MFTENNRQCLLNLKMQLFINDNLQLSWSQLNQNTHKPFYIKQH